MQIEEDKAISRASWRDVHERTLRIEKKAPQ
jgi:hypothetical protein